MWQVFTRIFSTGHVCSVDFEVILCLLNLSHFSEPSPFRSLPPYNFDFNNLLSGVKPLENGVK